MRRPSTTHIRRIAGFAAVLLIAATAWSTHMAQAKWITTGIGCNNNATIIEMLQAAQSGDLLAPVETDTSLEPSALISQAILTFQGDWRYTGTTFPPPNCNGSDSANTPPPDFSHDGQRQTFFGANSGASIGDGPLLTVGSTVRALEIDQLGLSSAWSADNGGLLLGNAIQGHAQITLSNLELTSGKADGRGGALYLVLRGGSTLTITGDACSAIPCRSRISGNQSGASFAGGNAPDSGGLYIDVGEGSRLVIENTEIGNNIAPGSGGGFEIIVRDGSSVVLRNNIIHDNQAQGQDSAQNPDPRNGGGGRIQIYDGTVQLSGNQFSNNQAVQGRGGGLAVEKTGTAGSAVVSIDATNSFSGNSAGLGNDDLYLSGDLLEPRGFLPLVRR